MYHKKKKLNLSFSLYNFLQFFLGIRSLLTIVDSCSHLRTWHCPKYHFTTLANKENNANIINWKKMKPCFHKKNHKIDSIFINQEARQTTLLHIHKWSFA